MRVKTDKDIYRYVKDILRDYQFDNILEIYLKSPSPKGVAEYHRFNISNIDELVGQLFDFSLYMRVFDIQSFASDYCHVSAFEISFSESSDYQTNITPRMIDFFRMIVDPYSRDNLVEALNPPKPETKDYLNWDGRFIIAPIEETNPWDYFEGEGD